MMAQDGSEGGATASPEAVEALRTRITPALERFFNTSRDLALRTAVADGWTEEEAQWIELHMRERLLHQVADGVEAAEAFETSYNLARRALTVRIFDAALAQGKSRMAAFLILVDLTIEMARRRGDDPPTYTDALLQAGCEAVEAAAREGATAAEQIDTGFAMMQSLMQWRPGNA